MARRAMWRTLMVHLTKNEIRETEITAKAREKSVKCRPAEKKSRTFKHFCLMVPTVFRKQIHLQTEPPRSTFSIAFLYTLANKLVGMMQVRRKWLKD